MVKLARGGRRQMLQGRPEPKPLFPPGKLPVFGPPPVNSRGPPLPPRHQRQGYGPGPGMPHRPPPLMRPLPPMGPPLPPPPPPHRAGPPPLMGPHPPLPLMGGPPHGMMPRPPPHFMQGRRPLMRPRPGMGPPLKRLNKNFRKKQRRNKFDEAEEGMEWCEVCERGFSEKEALEVHISEHTVCQMDGCSFEAHPKVVQLHFKMQHRTGLFSKLTDRQDVNSWIEQRKRNYPTLENIEKKKKMQEEMEQRGERLNDEADKKLPKRNLGHQKRGMNRKGRGSKRLQQVKRLEQQMNEENGGPPAQRRKTEALQFKSLISKVPEEAIVDVAQPDETNWSDGEWADSKKEAAQELPVNSSLLALRGYESDGTSDRETIGSKNVKEDKEKLSGGESGPEEVSLERGKEETKDVTGPSPGRKVPIQGEKNRPAPKKHQPRLPKQKQLTLLEKLLKNEIRHERNLILQCIRYIVSRNFFEEDSTKGKEITSNPVDKCENSTAVQVDK